MASWEDMVDEDTEYLFHNEDEIEEVDSRAVAKWRRVENKLNAIEKRWEYNNDVEDDTDEDHQGRNNWHWNEEKVHYPPERGPPIVDFISIFAAFVVAVIAAYYTMS